MYFRGIQTKSEENKNTKIKRRKLQYEWDTMNG